MRTLTTEIDIAASPEQVWAVLTDFGRYTEWNPFVVDITGAAEAGARLRVRMAPPGGRHATFTPTVTAVGPAKVLEWLGHLPVPGLFAGRHRFELHRTATGTHFVQGESFNGLLVPLLGALLRKTEAGFVAMNIALKARAEAHAFAR